MWKQQDIQIDRSHSSAICDEIGERLRISLGQSPLPLMLQRKLQKLRELDHYAATSIASDNFE